ncbi:MAG: Thioredoxin [Candidatus Falkowbacteria bacterium GW2011_GWC2_38_22]|uniref:Thioredoxin n=1 Tax=Candidatus Falkowbacteria bacterium GW2011_GWE1_38_31 TaxID=1618638 RepID=A0A0G0K523_9BACT|nr:MAG: Thioredoxin [Candidatus Falkowbacteria bacterium GW2011_GWF2_38_1205]KKQ61688.1 MAG: Thioredoxin [Candidatus Falkowbacteria bacterium GW2011_GWC2_38_22]KKQ63697.1 MAG: Thioredoxin [Candidatus Falkowbacteria bacterium GW2011_GWF1_38_22]KKQ65887.1 MAG: Thioredoxin [Candidatus Falkowbacteria bacterium GW2011_GWE2_38_254]KKQ70560.1 MAG: Thioredoxin [Candidatus Falkowbacteria bacterium GW2011_GWE1_38_31]KKQ72956.1 MAG: Thioredoxin [Candidatus Falkowbacteria bacterium GW2011_GWD2_38_42]HAM8
MSKQFTDANFNTEVLEASKQKPVLVDFFAPWCGPCKVQGPIVDTLADEIGDKAIVGKVNTEEAQQTAMNFGIMSIPTLMIFKDGEVKETMVGLQSKEGLMDLLKKYGA